MGAEPARAEAKRPAGARTRAEPAVRLSAFTGRETGALEHEADRAAEHALRFGAAGGASFAAASAAASSGVQRKCDCPAGACDCHEPEGLQRWPDAGGILSTAARLIGSRVAPTIVEDDVDAAPDQIRRAAFLSAARAAIVRAADEELAAVGRSTANCPYLEYWWSRFRGYGAARMERAVILFARPAARTPQAYVAAMVEATRERVRQWIASGSVAAPEDVDDLTATGETPAQARREDGRPAGRTSVPDEILSRLGAGRRLDAGVRGRMERGFGRSFGGVRIHTDAAASRAAAERGALALTIGSNILFRDGHYRPGTAGGDVLLAHELAHTIQQGGGGVVAATSDAAHEADADRAAAGAIGALHGGGAPAAPATRAGVTVQACTPTRKRCPPGMMWGNAARPETGTAGAGSFGCLCVYRCVPETYTPRESSYCPAGGCRRIRYEIVDENYVIERDGEVERIPVHERASESERAVGWGGSSTPLTAQHVCLCPGVNIEGDETGRREAVSMTPITTDVTDVVGPGVDIAQGMKARRRGLPTTPQTDPTTGTRIPGRTPEAPRAVHPAETRLRQAGLYTAEHAPRLDRLFREADPAILTALESTAEMPSGPTRTARLQRLLDWAEGRPGLPETIQEGETFGRGGTGSVAAVVGRPELASKRGAGRAATEAAAMVELELAGIRTVYLGERPVEGGGTRLVLRRIDGVGSKDIIGRTGRGPDDPARAAEYEQYVTPRTISDLEAIYQRLVDANLNVGDFQFIIRRSDGAVFVNDPTGVTPNSAPSGKIRNIIDRFTAILRRRSGEGETP